MDKAKLFRQLVAAETPDLLWSAVDELSDRRAADHDGQDAETVLRAAESVVIYGAGEFARTVLGAWSGNMPRIRCLVDSNPAKWGKSWCGYPVLAPAELGETLTGSLIVVAAMQTADIEEMLAARGITPLFAEQDGSVGYLTGSWLSRHREAFADLFGALGDDLSRKTMLSVSKARLFQSFSFPMKGNWFAADCATYPQYFSEDVLSFGEEESFIDCGAFDGDTVIDFAARMWRGNVRAWSAVAIEADQENLDRARRNLDAFGLRQVPVVHGTLGNRREFLHACRISGEAPRIGPSLALDEIPCEKTPTFIKMDIEGAELEALQSGQNLLARLHPKLAICTYHKTSDLLDIPLFIHRICPDYKLAIRHHRAGSLWETVCYAALPR